MLSNMEATNASQKTRSNRLADHERGAVNSVADDADAVQSLDGVKRDVYSLLRDYKNRHLPAGSRILLNISDSAYQKMLENPAYKNEILQQILHDMGSLSSPCASFSSGRISIGEDGDYRFDAFIQSKAASFPSINENCYWDKRSLKIKEDMEKSIEKHALKKRRENEILQKDRIEEQVLDSANRRSSLDGELCLL